VRSPLKSTRVRRIVAAYTINRLGTWFGYVALSLAVFQHTHSALWVATLLIAGQALPAFVVPSVVARIEASSGRAKLSWLYLLETLLTIGLALLLWNFWLPLVLVLVFLDGTAALAANSLLRAEAARVAREETNAERGEEAGPDERSAAAHAAERSVNAALNIAFSCTFVLGPALAGLVVAAAGGPAALLIDAASFLICGAMLTDLRPAIQAAERDSVAAMLRAVWSHIGEVVTLRNLLIAEGVAIIFFAADAAIEVPYATVTLDAGESGYGLLLTAWGVGMAFGSIVFARTAHRRVGVLLIAGTAAVGLAYVGFAVAPSLAVACLAGFLGGAGNGVQWASLLSAVQQLTPPTLHGRMMGVVEAINAFCPGIGLLLGGALVAVSSPRTAFLVVGLGATAMTVAFLRFATVPALQPRVAAKEDAPALESIR
jgi:MFS family permease